jgi:hypothetical protein
MEWPCWPALHRQLGSNVCQPGSNVCQLGSVACQPRRIVLSAWEHSFVSCSGGFLRQCAASKRAGPPRAAAGRLRGGEPVRARGAGRPGQGMAWLARRVARRALARAGRRRDLRIRGGGADVRGGMRAGRDSERCRSAGRRRRAAHEGLNKGGARGTPGAVCGRELCCDLKSSPEGPRGSRSQYGPTGARGQ